MTEPGDAMDNEVRCARCGRLNPGKNRFCTGCGAPLPTGSTTAKVSGLPRSALIAIVISCLVIALLAGGIAAGVVLLNRPPDVEMPTTASELEDSVQKASEYLNDEGKKLAEGKVEGAPVYSISARLDTGDNTISGREVVLYTNTTGDTLDRLVMRVYANAASIRGELKEVEISEVTVDGDSAGSSLQGSLLTITLPGGLAPGEQALVGLDFKEWIPEIAGGLTGLESMLGASEIENYGIFGRSEDIYNLGYWNPVIASYRDGKWESRETPVMGDVEDFEFSYYNVALDVPSNMVVAATGMPAGEESGGGRKVYGYTAGPVRDFGVQASISYKTENKKVGDTLVTSYYLEGTEKVGAETLEYACNALTQYSEHFGPYVYRRFNVCEAPLAGGAAGMEFAGQIMLGQMLYGDFGSLGLEMPEELDVGGETLDLEGMLEGLTGSLLGETLEFVAAHEVGHQWWGLGVGSDSIGHPWQDESLTNYSSVLYFRWQHGEEAAEKQLQMQLVMPYTTGTMFSGDAVVDTPVDGFAGDEQYVAAVYSKGALFYEALEEQMGSEAFLESLREYYEKYVFTNATPEELVACFEDNASDPGAVAALHQRWILEKHGEEDIGTMLPDMDILDQYFEDLLDGELDLGPLEDLLDEYLPGEDFDGDSAPLPSDEPEFSI